MCNSCEAFHICNQELMGKKKKKVKMNHLKGVNELGVGNSILTKARQQTRPFMDPSIKRRQFHLGNS